MVQKYATDPSPGPFDRGARTAAGSEAGSTAADAHVPPPFSIRVDTTADHAVAALFGELDIASMDALADRLSALLYEGRVRIVLDLAGLEFCDMAGLRVLMRCRRRAAEYGGWLRLAGVRPRIGKLFQLARVAALFAFYPTVADALAEAAQKDDAPMPSGSA